MDINDKDHATEAPKEVTEPEDKCDPSATIEPVKNDEEVNSTEESEEKPPTAPETTAKPSDAPSTPEKPKNEETQSDPFIDYTYTHCCIVLDASGSMGSIREETLKSIEKFVEDQKNMPGKCTIDLYQFSDRDRIIKLISTKNVKKINPKRIKYIPSGSTALNDATAKALIECSMMLSNLRKKKSRPHTVIMAIVTDGEENDSYSYHGAVFEKLIEKAKNGSNDEKFSILPGDYEANEAYFNNFGVKYEFIYLGAMPTKIAEENNYWVADGQGIANANRQISMKVAAARFSGLDNAAKMGEKKKTRITKQQYLSVKKLYQETNIMAGINENDNDDLCNAAPPIDVYSQLKVGAEEANSNLSRFENQRFAKGK